jgi:hypothetical protein
MERQGHLTRAIVIAIWSIAAITLFFWSLLALGGHALLSDGGAWIVALIDPWIASTGWEAQLESLLAWGESAGTVALWVLWALGSLGMLLTCAFATLLYLRVQRAMERPS